MHVGAKINNINFLHRQKIYKTIRLYYFCEQYILDCLSVEKTDLYTVIHACMALLMWPRKNKEFIKNLRHLINNSPTIFCFFVLFFFVSHQSSSDFNLNNSQTKTKKKKKKKEINSL